MRDTEVIRNPSRRDVERLLRTARGGALRACKDRQTGDIYVWDAEAASHREMIERLRLEMGDSIGFVLSPDDLTRLNER